MGGGEGKSSGGHPRSRNGIPIQRITRRGIRARIARSISLNVGRSNSHVSFHLRNPHSYTISSTTVLRRSKHRAKSPSSRRGLVPVPSRLILVGLTIAVHNGRQFIPVFVTENMVGHKLGEFSPTRTFRGHADKKGQEAIIAMGKTQTTRCRSAKGRNEEPRHREAQQLPHVSHGRCDWSADYGAWQGCLPGVEHFEVQARKRRPTVWRSCSDSAIANWEAKNAGLTSGRFRFDCSRESRWTARAC